ncbi:MAG: tRNA (adenosine(37)-N6)-threonylcarbamoyltransferase complex transferase subunit TsaD [Clostridiaceae bacterium]
MTKSEDKLILSIESSCDETAIAVVKNGRDIMSNIITSQIPLHRKFGGVVPEVASRKHIESIDTVLELALEEAGITLNDVDAIAVTKGPGLVGALLVGLQYAKGLAFAAGKPLIGVNHIRGHIAANFIEHKDLKPPFVSLVVSGGHTYIVNVSDYDKYEVVAETRDDAVGEAYDKVARSLGLRYPGGPEIDKLAKEGNENAITFTRPKFHEDTLDFSFSGIKSAVLNYLNTMALKKEEVNKADVAASFQKAVISNLTDNLLEFAKSQEIKKIAVCGGVASNSYLRKTLFKIGEENNIEILFPNPVLCTDNAAMIGSAAYYQLIKGDISSLSLNADPNLSIEG